jgi:hypothetical protein
MGLKPKDELEDIDEISRSERINPSSFFSKSTYPIVKRRIVVSSDGLLQPHKNDRQ